MKWFGKSWGAPVCGYTEHAATPVGEFCMRCNQLIRAEDAGFILPSIEEIDPARNLALCTQRPWHRYCFLTSILGEKKALEIEQGEESWNK